MEPQWFRDQREDRGWTRAQCASHAGVHKSTWGRWESGAVVASPEMVIALRERFEGAKAGAVWYETGNWYFRHRHAKGQSQIAAAKAIGVNVSTYRKWETETKKPDLTQAMMIAAWADCGLGDVMKVAA